jgi:hypothetical protein
VLDGALSPNLEACLDLERVCVVKDFRPLVAARGLMVVFGLARNSVKLQCALLALSFLERKFDLFLCPLAKAVSACVCELTVSLGIYP